MPLQKKCFRPCGLPHRFAEIKLDEDGVCRSKDYEIRRGPKGRSLFILKPSAGLLIPISTVGSVITADKYKAMRKGPLEKRRYIITSHDEKFYYDVSPHLQEYEDCLPGAFANEATDGVDEELYNCEFVYLNAGYYPNMPNYPGIVKSSEMVFLEVMVTMASRHVPSGGIEAFVYYNQQEKREGSAGKMCNWGYKAKDFNWGNVARGFGAHWSTGTFCKNLIVFEQEWKETQAQNARQIEKETRKRHKINDDIRRGKRSVTGVLLHNMSGKKKRKHA